MDEQKRPMTILMAEDDTEDQMMIKDAFAEAEVKCNIEIVPDGEALMDYLNRNGKYSDVILPDIILLDLNMPKKNGLEALKEIKNDEQLKELPVVVLTTSKADEDMTRSYDLGVSLYTIKPVTFGKMIELAKWVGKYWLELDNIPDSAN